MGRSHAAANLPGHLNCHSPLRFVHLAVVGPFGFVVIDKPAGLTSHSCVSRLRRCFGLKRVGHGGTLDPAVTGVLPIALGAATRLLPYLPGDKTYRGSIQLGRTTNSDDLEGEVLTNQSWPALSANDLEAALHTFRGPIQQRPPQVSAVHVDGVRAHERARRGEHMHLPPRPVTIHRLEMQGWDPNNGRLDLEVHCSAGTYIRSLARDLGEQIGCGGCLASLRRIQALGFQIEQASPLPEWPDESDATSQRLPPVLPPQQALKHLAAHEASDTDRENWRCGRRLHIANGLGSVGETLMVVHHSGQMLGLGLIEADSQLRPKVVFDARG
ncbi:tRNA pseudouridine(55) synthase TruB [Synechococcus sp. UW105]|uniref:tRNA pseudouridine(55) synthase TruB n=1 Tax=Synechococcus sp. UW105 TaxID=337067 RepID=UPI000E0F32CA|nr:tRNA pseudouridine(55) synthase TruB [Synechococcus sp. UW105]